MSNIDRESTSTSFKANPEPQEKKPVITRRNFLRAFLVGSAAVALKGSSAFTDSPTAVKAPLVTENQLSRPLPTVEAEVVVSPQERFEKLGISEFWPFYQIVVTTTAKFGARSESHYFYRIFDICERVASGDINSLDNPELTSIRDGWGEKKESVIDDALAHIKAINVQNHDTSGDPEKFRNEQLTTFAKVFGSMALALPKDIYLTAYAAQTSKDFLATVSFDQWGAEEAWNRFFHEVTHSTDVFSDRVQPYVTKKAFLEYASTYYKLSDDLLTQWLAVPDLEQARVFWNGPLPSWGGDIPEAAREIVSPVEQLLFNQEYTDESLGYRFIRIAWTAGKKFLEIQNKKLNKIALTTEEEALLTNRDVQSIMTWNLEETLHFLVSSADETFYGPNATDVEVNKINDARIAMDQVRVATFGTFEQNPDQDIGKQVRAQLGIE